MATHTYRHIDYTLYTLEKLQVASVSCVYYAVYRGDVPIMCVLIDNDHTPGGDDTIRVVYINPDVHDDEVNAAYWRVRSGLFCHNLLSDWYHVMCFLHQRYYEPKENLTPTWWRWPHAPPWRGISFL